MVPPLAIDVENSDDLSHGLQDERIYLRIPRQSIMQLLSQAFVVDIQPSDISGSRGFRLLESVQRSLSIDLLVSVVKDVFAQWSQQSRIQLGMIC